MVTLLLPVFVSVTVCVGALPRFTLPKEMFVGFTESVAVAAMVLPVRTTVVGAVAAVLINEIAPLILPADSGVNCTLKLLDCPAAKVNGRFKPVALKPVPPVTLAWLIVKLPFPLLLIRMSCVLVLPTTTFVKLTDAGDTARLACTPVPVVATVVVPDVETMPTEPLKAAAVFGLNCTFNVALCDGASVSGVSNATRRKT